MSATSDPSAAPAPEAIAPASPLLVAWGRVKPVLLAMIVPAALLAFWHHATTNGWTLLIPPPADVA